MVYPRHSWKWYLVSQPGPFSIGKVVPVFKGKITTMVNVYWISLKQTLLWIVKSVPQDQSTAPHIYERLL